MRVTKLPASAAEELSMQGGQHPFDYVAQMGADGMDAIA